MGFAGVITLGPVNVPVWFLVSAGCVAVALAASAMVLRRHRRLRRVVLDLLLGMVVAFLVGWKLTPAVLRPSLLLTDPLPLLAASPGAPGVAVGAAASGVYGLLRLRRRRLRRISIRPLVVFAACLAVCLGAAALVGRLAAPARRAAPAMTLADAQGAVTDLAQLRGRVVVLNFWATWCPPCRAELPDLLAFHADRLSHGAHLVSVNMTDTESSVDGVTGFARARGLDFPILLDRTGGAARAYDVTVVPTTIVITPGGEVSAVRTGAVDAGWLRRAVREAAASR